ncbi:MAG: hypothetical protein N5P05_003562 [Chroococcopsis gigantea SAG 12.99]|jgi:prepilin-type N-terminal cleavage/methylation domain-containing protein|nr:hypothetical protein [Chroococcopsis gigantea SAG 12.99]
MNNFYRPSSSVQGFTLVEMLITSSLLLIIGAMSVPNLFRFLNLQTLRASNEQLELGVRQAQNLARQRNVAYTVQVQTINSTPQFAMFPTGQTPTSWTDLASRPDTITADITQGSQIIFASDGSLAPQSPIQPGEEIILNVFVSPATNTRRCVMVQTLLGSIKNGKGTECQ